MRLSRLFTDQALNLFDTVTLDSKKSHYLTHVLRLKKGQSIVLFNGIETFDYLASISKTGKMVDVTIEKSLQTHNESALQSCLFLALSKNDHLDFSIQKCTELGVSSIIIFNSEHTQIPLKKSHLDKKIAHWKRIAQSACEQCGRSIVPKISFHFNISHALALNHQEIKLMLDFDGTSIQQQLAKSKSASKVDILLGAEGGLSSNEIQIAEQFGFKKIRLGPRVLRTETAAIGALSMVQMLLGDLDLI